MKITLSTITSVTLLLFAISAAGQNKTVVIPLNTATIQTVAKSGQTFAGQLNSFKPGGTTAAFEFVGASYPLPLPAGTPSPTLEVLASTSATCPGIGQATSGILCIYTYNTADLSSIEKDIVGWEGENRLYGFSLEIYYNGSVADGWVRSSWAYQVP